MVRNMKILILGHKGMLGNCVHKYLKKFYEIDTTEHRWPTNEFKDFIEDYDGDFIVNCIGAIPQKNNLFDINYDLPLFLEQNSNCRIIHPSSDCESFDTLYERSKLEATNWLVENSQKTKIIKCSIVGLELNGYNSLMSWFISKTDQKVFGFADAWWNGITTLQWAKIAKAMIESWDLFKELNIFQTDCVTKYELLSIINRVFNLNKDIIPKFGFGKNRCLDGFYVGTIEEQIWELKKFYEENK